MHEVGKNSLDLIGCIPLDLRLIISNFVGGNKLLFF